MIIEKMTLLALREDAEDLDSNAFVEQYSGYMLIAMGCLTAKDMSDPVKSWIPGLEGEPTTAMTFGDRPEYEAPGKHPLAGLGFFFDTTSGESNMLVGRSESCDVTVPDASVSDIHCSIVILDDGGMTITDADSTNGTAIDHKRITPQVAVPVVDESVITFGRYSFQLCKSSTLYRMLRQV